MRLALFIILVLSLAMCKSKDIPSQEQMRFYVLMVDGASPSQLKKATEYSILEFKPSSKSKNQWAIDFQDEGNSDKIRVALLNSELVISVVDADESGNIQSKNNKKAKVGPIGSKTKQKQ